MLILVLFFSEFRYLIFNSIQFHIRVLGCGVKYLVVLVCCIYLSVVLAPTESTASHLRYSSFGFLSTLHVVHFFTVDFEGVNSLSCFFIIDIVFYGSLARIPSKLNCVQYLFLYLYRFCNLQLKLWNLRHYIFFRIKTNS